VVGRGSRTPLRSVLGRGKGTGYFSGSSLCLEARPPGWYDCGVQRPEVVGNTAQGPMIDMWRTKKLACPLVLALALARPCGPTSPGGRGVKTGDDSRDGCVCHLAAKKPQPSRAFFKNPSPFRGRVARMAGRGCRMHARTQPASKRDRGIGGQIPQLQPLCLLSTTELPVHRSHN